MEMYSLLQGTTNNRSFYFFNFDLSQKHKKKKREIRERLQINGNNEWNTHDK